MGLMIQINPQSPGLPCITVQADESYAPDVMHDLMNRAVEMYRDLIADVRRNIAEREGTE